VPIFKVGLAGKSPGVSLLLSDIHGRVGNDPAFFYLVFQLEIFSNSSFEKFMNICEITKRKVVRRGFWLSEMQAVSGVR
jgi:hypothetical protein